MVGSNGAIRGSASVGLGVTLVSRDAVAAELADGRLSELPVPGTPLHRDWYLVAHPGPLARPGRGCSSTCSATAASGRQLLIQTFSVIAKLSIDGWPTGWQGEEDSILCHRRESWNAGPRA